MQEHVVVPSLSVESTRCPVCGGDQVTTLREAFDDRYGHPGSFYLARCCGCDHLMTLPMLQEKDLASLYGTYYPRKDLSSDDVARQAVGVGSLWSAFKRWFMGVDNQGQYDAQRGERMLDVGCGSGLSLLEAREFGVEAWGVEADPNVERISRELGLRIHQGTLQDQPFPGVAFDLVVLNQVIEHIPKPDEALVLIRSRIAVGGRVILVFPNVKSFWCKLAGARWINWHVPYHLHHFTAETFVQMAERCGYQFVRSRTITPNVWTILQLRASRLSPVRGQPSRLWQHSSSGAEKNADRVSRRLIPRLLFALAVVGISVVNRCVDAFGLGDSLIVELIPLEPQ